jgi:hypothetical protein
MGINFCYFARFIKHFGACQFLSNSLFIGLSWAIVCCLVIFQGGITSMLDDFFKFSFLCSLHCLFVSSSKTMSVEDDTNLIVLTQDGQVNKSLS